ncbi:hypothetical protein HSX11_01765 [Oxalobacteraceae bacterium]|nr:hypothetical protein [Oxalobacteraceae bacterium]
MIDMGDIASAAAGQAWKVATWALVAVLLTVGAAGGTALWLTAAERDKAVVDLRAEKAVSEDLRTGIREQNHAVEAMGKAKLAAEARGLAAQKAAAVDRQRYETASAHLAGAAASTCAEAMPYVNQLLRDIR